MKIESIYFYDAFDNYYNGLIPSYIYDTEYTSLYELAYYVLRLLESIKHKQAIVFIDNHRFMTVTTECFQVHYICHFNKQQNK